MELDFNSANLMHRLNSISIASNPSLEVPNLSSSYKKKADPLIVEPPSEMFSDRSKNMLDNSVNELKDLLNEICQEGNALLKKFQTQVPSSNLKRLEAMIPKLNETSNKITKNLSSLVLKEKPINVKRDFKEFGERDEEDIIEVQPASNGYKKVKTESSKEEAPDIIMVGNAFTIKFLCHTDIQSYLPPERQYRYGKWTSDGSESAVVLKREDFLFLPPQVTLRLSKEHAKISARKIDKEVVYEITDLSVNGTYYLGNRKEGNMKQSPIRLQKGIPFKLKPGDWICLLLKKDTAAPEVLLGFEFQLEDN